MIWKERLRLLLIHPWKLVRLIVPCSIHFIKYSLQIQFQQMQYSIGAIGRHVVAVEVDGHPVKGSPFYCNVYNVNNIKVTGLGPAKVCI